MVDHVVVLSSYLSPPPSRLNGHAKIASKRAPSHLHSLPAATKSLLSNKGCRLLFCITEGF
ncbi:uncharacterized protein LACBIDRAFT_299425 [Laccaria bicolor S238N-H82]|uniref:Predicted protein n=1 Tax=Laccaria bicolor (strain S238N-H82 / ATCC MYA-4686) TaxID=486041 RepID=B0DEN6_LACBS|nr:uncharacterized protein LACBIDRAFT_299425 [Laccaria bicolor S238N-H82]EDR07060.1 predicted protein [Laccaria bicolor S238N-H82]|eukprot:XP_001882433.1 predicted protein [Laccaria bicolor S238N-H82]